MLVDSARQRQPFTHFLSIPIQSDEISEKFEDFKFSTMDDDSRVSLPVKCIQMFFHDKNLNLQFKLCVSDCDMGCKFNDHRIPLLSARVVLSVARL